VTAPLVPSGEKPYLSNVTGALVHPTTPKFTALYDSEDQCRQAVPGGTPRRRGGAGRPLGVTSVAQASPVSAPGNGAENEKAVVLRVVEALIRQTEG